MSNQQVSPAAHQQSVGTHSPSTHSATATEGVHPTFGLRSVAEQPAAEQQLETVSKLYTHRRLSADELERHIESCAWLMEDAMRRYYESGCFSHRGEADRWRLLMEEAIKSRSPETVARMEQERGLT